MSERNRRVRVRVRVRGVAGVMAAGLLAGLVTAFPAHAVTPVACSETALRTAINTSNATMGGDTLSLTSYCVYTLTDANGQLPAIVQSLVIQGNNATIRRDPNATNEFRIFQVSGSSLTMDTLTVMNGNIPTSGTATGGGVYLDGAGGSLTTTGVNFQGNTAGVGGAIAAQGNAAISLTGGTMSDNRGLSQGGGMRVVGSTSLTLNSVTVLRNRTVADGAGLFISTSLPAAITNSTISGNTAQSSGAGMRYAGSSTLTVTGTSFTNNRVTASTGGGGGVEIAQAVGAVTTFTGSNVSGNTVTGFNTPTSTNNLGGGIRFGRGTLVLDSTTVSGNQLVGAGGTGAGIGVRPIGTATATLTLQNGTTVTGNLASGRYSQGGGLYTANGSGTVSVSLTGSHIDANKVTGTGAVSGGVYNAGATYSFATSSVNDNIAPAAPAPGGVYTTVPITTVDGATTFTGNTPTNCLLSPAAVTNCVN